MSDLTPRKLPQQGRSRATVDAIVEAAARILREQGYAALTTNTIAGLAGVSVGSLYRFFPNKQAIVLAVLSSRLEELSSLIADDLRLAMSRDGVESMQYLVERLVERVDYDQALFRLLVRELPMLRQPEAVRAALERISAIGRSGADAAAARIDFPDPEMDVWLVIQMVGNAVLEICFAAPQGRDRQRLIRELAVLTHRMLGTAPSAAATAS
jgi:AcrR family transcriptional regulator